MNMIVLMGGVSGSGKTTVGALLAKRLNWLFADGDAFHPAANIAKMRSGVPLTDADRWPWLKIIAQWMDDKIAAGESAVVPCSLLKRSYRDLLLTGRPAARLVFLTASRDVLHARLVARHGHFFTAKLLDSQFADLELPQPPENVLTLDAAAAPAELADEIIARLGLVGSAAGARASREE
jgi:gluconokinase